jgi:hypothetical protein
MRKVRLWREGRRVDARSWTMAVFGRYGLALSDIGEGMEETNWLVDSCAWTHDVGASELGSCYLEHLV